MLMMTFPEQTERNMAAECTWPWAACSHTCMCLCLLGFIPAIKQVLIPDLCGIVVLFTSSKGYLVFFCILS